MRKSQVSMEHLMMVAVALLTILPMVYLFYSYSQSSAQGINLARLNKFSRSLINNAESVYYLGEASRITIEESMPDYVKNMTIKSDDALGIYELTFILGDDSEVAFSSNVNITGDFDETDFSEGLKNIMIESMGKYVLINIS